MALRFENGEAWVTRKRAEVRDAEPLSIQHNISALSQRLWKAEQTLEQVRRLSEVPDDGAVAIATDGAGATSSARIFASSSLSRIGVLSLSRQQLSGPGASRLPSGPSGVSICVTSSSRMASSGGLVTCANSCLK